MALLCASLFLIAPTCGVEPPPPEPGLVMHNCPEGVTDCAPLALAYELAYAGYEVSWFAHYGGQLLVLQPGECLRIDDRLTAGEYVGHSVIDGQPVDCGERPGYCFRVEPQTQAKPPCSRIWEPD